MDVQNIYVSTCPIDGIERCYSPGVDVVAMRDGCFHLTRQDGLRKTTSFDFIVSKCIKECDRGSRIWEWEAIINNSHLFRGLYRYRHLARLSPQDNPNYF